MTAVEEDVCHSMFSEYMCGMLSELGHLQFETQEFVLSLSDPKTAFEAMCNVFGNIKNQHEKAASKIPSHSLGPSPIGNGLGLHSATLTIERLTESVHPLICI